MKTYDPSQLLVYLDKHGPSSGKTICEALQLSQPTMSRWVKALGDQLLVIGKARTVHYAARRVIDGLPVSMPIYEVLSNGTSRIFGILNPVAPRGFYFESKCKDVHSELYADLPYFLNDMRPAGFLGRLVPAQNLDLKLPPDIRNWSTEHVLKYLYARGWNTIGNLIVGDAAFSLYIAQQNSEKFGIHHAKREKFYAKFADNVLSLGDAGSSAGGEQPKFSTLILPEKKHVLVKFSPPCDTPIGRRIADLLICEHIALQVLHEHKFLTAQSEIIEGDNRLFLESTRFDRELGKGRHGVISLGSLDAQFTGVMGSWHETTTALAKIKKIPQHSVEKIQWLSVFGELIANNDMHLYNLSFFTQGNRIIDLAPVYDMSPMLFMPRHHQLIDKKFAPKTPAPHEAKVWAQASMAAGIFWKEVVAHKKISTESKVIAQQALVSLEKLNHMAQLLAQ